MCSTAAITAATFAAAAITAATFAAAAFSANFWKSCRNRKPD